MAIRMANNSQGLLSVLPRSRIYPDKCRTNDKGMPAFYDFEWNDFRISVVPDDFRRFKVLRNIPFLSNYLSGSNIRLAMNVTDLLGGNRPLSYNWSLDRVINGEYNNVDNNIDFQCKANTGHTVIYDRRLHMDGKHILLMEFAIINEARSGERVMAEFTISDRDTAMLKRSQVIGGLVLAGIIALLIKLFVG